MPALAIVHLSGSGAATAAAGVSTPSGGLLADPPAQATNAPTVDVSIRPSDAQGNPVPGPGYFVVDAESGSSVPLFALVSNTGGTPLEAQVVPVDAVTSDTGGIAYRLPNDPRQSVGAWVSLNASRFPVDAAKGVVTPFTVNVPPGTPAGQYVGGLTAFVPATNSQTQQGQAGQQFAVVVQTRSVAAIVVNVPGPRRAEFSISGAEGTYRPDSAYVVLRIRNTGNVLLQAKGSLAVTRQGDSAPAVSGPFSVDTTVPNSEFAYPIRWTRQPDLGRYRIHVDLTWEAGNGYGPGSTSWDGEFTVAPDATPTPRPGAQAIVVSTPSTAQGRPATTGGTITIGTNTLLVAVLALLGVVIVGLLIVIATLLRRRGPQSGGTSG